MTDYSKYINSKNIHYIANSGSDERGKYSGGKLGDQTGKEWQLKAYYSRPWTVIARHPDAKVRQKLAELGIQAALNDNIGYDQNKRLTYWNELKKVKYNPSAIKTKCADDCSAGVSANIKAAGYLLNNSKLKSFNQANTTRSLKAALKAAGFEIYTDNKYTNSSDYLLPGDILLNEGHHTAMNITIGSKVSANRASKPSITKSSTVKKEEKKTTTKSSTKTAQLDGAKTFDKDIAGEYTTTAKLNMRKGASKDKDVITVIPKGGKVNCYGYKTGSWYLVNYKNYTGYCSSQYLKK